MSLLLAGSAIGSTLMSMERAKRHRAPVESHKSESFGKTIGHHQVVPADQAVRVANTVRTDLGKAILSGTGGNPRIVEQALSHASRVIPVSPYHAKAIMRAGNHLKYKPFAKSLISH
tara:strand:- start:54 stop:404 length:351 start_codon:yes stop_codon:yes gene_type:complete